MFQNLSLGNLVCYLTCVVFYTDFKWTADVDHNLQMINSYFYFTDIRNRLDMLDGKYLLLYDEKDMVIYLVNTMYTKKCIIMKGVEKFANGRLKR